MGGLAQTIKNDNGIIIGKDGKQLAFLPPSFFAEWRESHEREKGEGIPAAAAPDTGYADTGLNISSSSTKRKKGLKGKRGLMIGYTGGSTGGTTGIGLNI